MLHYLPYSHGTSINRFDAANEALINEYFSSEKMDEAAENCVRLVNSRSYISNNNNNYYKKKKNGIKVEQDYDTNVIDPALLSYEVRKLKWRNCIIKELDRINRGLFQWNPASLLKFNEE
ncbi:unnamed protein product [Trichobilharzia regenti]|nr:unnamed protein product [Trichobilharzia regenti]